MKFPMAKCPLSKDVLKMRRRKRNGVLRHRESFAKLIPSVPSKWSQLHHFELQSSCENISPFLLVDKRNKGHETNTAPSECRVWGSTVVSFDKWSKQLPAGFEKLLCTLLAIFLCLFLLSTQLYIWWMGRARRQVRVAFCPVSSMPHQGITFECHVKLLIAAWLLSILTAFFVLAVYFLYWLCMDSYSRSKDISTQTANKSKYHN